MGMKRSRLESFWIKEAAECSELRTQALGFLEAKAKASFFDEGMGVSVIFQGTVIGLLTLFAYYIGQFVLPSHTHELGMTMAFATLSITELAHAFNVRSADKSLFKMGFFTNKMLTLAMFGSLLLQLAVLTIPPLQAIFKVAPMGLEQWLIVLGLSLSIIPIVEIQKIFLRLRKKG